MTNVSPTIEIEEPYGLNDESLPLAAYYYCIYFIPNNILSKPSRCSNSKNEI